MDNDGGTGPTGAAEVDLRVPAGPAQLASIRVVTAEVADQAGFVGGAVADVTLAVDEACSILISRAREGAWLRCRFRTGRRVLRFHGEVGVATAWVPEPGSLRWRVIGSLADAASTWVEAANREIGGRLHVELRLRVAG